MQTLGLIWVGTRTPRFEDTRRFFESTLELPVGNERPHFVRFDLPDSGTIEVFDVENDPYTHFSTGPVVGFQVGDFGVARSELVSDGYSLLGPVGGEPGAYRWQHLQGPDGLVFEIVDYPGRPPRRAPVGPLHATKLVWMGFSTPNFPRATHFYKETLGLPVEEETADLIECRLPDGSSVEAFRRGSDMDHPYFRTGPVPTIGVMDLDEALRILRERGVVPLATRRRPLGGWAHIRAPDGNVYAIKQSALGYRW